MRARVCMSVRGRGREGERGDVLSEIGENRRGIQGEMQMRGSGRGGMCRGYIRGKRRVY